jgi:large subunit ribosomal protein L24
MEQKSKYQTKFKILKGDQVIVLTGRSRGVTGTVEKVDLKHDKVFVAGANLYKRHQKPTMQNPDGGIVEKPMPLHVSNVAIVDPKTKKATRVGFQVDSATGKKVRVTKASGSVLS